MNKIQLYITSECQLFCKFCIKKRQEIPEIYMTQDEFERIVDQCVDNGIDTFELTPIVGEVFTDPQIIDKFEYLESLDSVKEYWFFTNLHTLADHHINFLNRSEKLRMTISVYGDNSTKFWHKTGYGCGAYDNFHMSMRKLNKYTDLSFIKEFNFRYKVDDVSMNLMHPLWRAVMMRSWQKGNPVEVVFDHEDFHWEGIIKNWTRAENSGVCRYARDANIVFPNGDVSLCGCLDINSDLLIGNIFRDGWGEVMANREYLLNEQEQGNYIGLCHGCTLFDNDDS